MTDIKMSTKYKLSTDNKISTNNKFSTDNKMSTTKQNGANSCLQIKTHCFSKLPTDNTQIVQNQLQSITIYAFHQKRNIHSNKRKNLLPKTLMHIRMKNSKQKQQF